MNEPAGMEANSVLVLLLQTAALGQLSIAVLNLFLVHLLGWNAELVRMPLLMREVFHVHAWFISVTLLIFGLMTWRFAGELAGGVDPMARWLAGGIGLFWSIRAVLQVSYYSSSHWRGQTARTLIHIFLVLFYGGLGALYVGTSFKTW